MAPDGSSGSMVEWPASRHWSSFWSLSSSWSSVWHSRRCA